MDSKAEIMTELKFMMIAIRIEAIVWFGRQKIVDDDAGQQYFIEGW